MQDEWFRWEREAAIHFLFPTLEASMKPLQKYTGFPFPTTVLVFKEGMVTWRNPEGKFYQLGAKFLETYFDKIKEKKMVSDTRKALRVLQETEAQVGHVDLFTLSNQRLVALYKRLHQTFLNYYSIGAIQEPLAMEAERELKEELELSDEQLAVLTTPAKGSFAKEAEKYLLETRNAADFIRRYFWVENNYAQVRILTREEAEKRLKNLLKAKPPGNLQSKKQLPSKLDKRGRKLVELLKHFAIYQDKRKKGILIYLHFLNLIFLEISRRTGLKKENVKNTFPAEVEEMLAGRISDKAISERRKYCLVVWEEGRKRPEILIGSQARKTEAVIFSKAGHRANAVIGNSASPGKVRGCVRILKSSKDCHLLQEGKVLVTFMTSPDFMVAIRKAGAIVTNWGGITSHAAIISRELDIPCIVGTKVATEVLKTGDLVEVDADKGIVRRLS